MVNGVVTFFGHLAFGRAQSAANTTLKSLQDGTLRDADPNVQGEYGYCEVTEEAIGLGRLTARPIAAMSVEAQQAHERREKITRDG